MTVPYNDFIIDCESFSSRPDALCVDISIVIFNPDPTVVQTFEELVSQGKRFKLSIASQKGVRSIMPETIKWWSEQSPEAKKHLIPSEDDLTVEDAVIQAMQFLKDNNVQHWKSQMWCRGMSFDVPIFVDMMRQTYKVDYTQEIEPVKFWLQRDVRTAIESYALQRNVIKTPLKKGMLDGFIAHDSIHDCAKDVLMLKTAQRYAFGLEEFPEEDDIDETTIKKKKV